MSMFFYFQCITFFLYGLKFRCRCRSFQILHWAPQKEFIRGKYEVILTTAKVSESRLFNEAVQIKHSQSRRDESWQSRWPCACHSVRLYCHLFFRQSTLGLSIKYCGGQIIDTIAFKTLNTCYYFIRFVRGSCLVWMFPAIGSLFGNVWEAA